MHVTQVWVVFDSNGEPIKGFHNEDDAWDTLDLWEETSEREGSISVIEIYGGLNGSLFYLTEGRHILGFYGSKYEAEDEMAEIKLEGYQKYSMSVLSIKVD